MDSDIGELIERTHVLVDRPKGHEEVTPHRLKRAMTGRLVVPETHRPTQRLGLAYFQGSKSDEMCCLLLEIFGEVGFASLDSGAPARHGFSL